MLYLAFLPYTLSIKGKIQGYDKEVLTYNYKFAENILFQHKIDMLPEVHWPKQI